MKKRVALLLTIPICIFLILNTAGCWNRRELNTLSILMGLGLDKSKNSGEVQLTAQIAKVEKLKTSKEGGGGSEDAYINIESTGSTVFYALRNFTHKSSRKMYLPHNQVIIFGRNIAEEGVHKYIDFFLRDTETRFTVWVLVSKTTAREILESKPYIGKITAMDISDLVKSQTATSETSIVRLDDFITRLLTKTMAPIAPIASISEKGGKKEVYISGTAVFKQDKMTGQLDKTETRGLLWVLGDVKSGIINVDCPDNTGKASLEIIRASSKITPEMKDNNILIKVKITEEGNLSEQSCTENLVLPSMIAVLEEEKAEAIRGEVTAALKKARELNADIFGFGEAVHKKYPKLWKELESRWDEIFPFLEVEIIVDAKLRRTGTITKPANP